MDSQNNASISTDRGFSLRYFVDYVDNVYNVDNIDHVDHVDNVVVVETLLTLLKLFKQSQRLQLLTVQYGSKKCKHIKKLPDWGEGIYLNRCLER